ncbi:MAG: nuclear transport factor 2 family protein [Gammaproteobacteria bacterium]|nr:nuclear transport factor 2 family protein [Gammaproteobacteria bacterium]
MSRIEDIVACEQLIRRFAWLNDAGQYEQLAALFTDDGLFARPSPPAAPVLGREAILASFQARPPRYTRHVVSNILVDVIGGDRAVALSTVVLYVADHCEGEPPYPSTGPVMVGSFEDALVKRDGRWLFASRFGSLALSQAPVPR